MPGLPAGSGSGSGVLGLGPAQNTFGVAATADRAAAEALRDAYQGNNAAWLALYNDNRSLWIRLVWADGTVEQRRNAAGDAWEDVSHVIRGRAGRDGNDAVADIVRFWGPGQARAMPAAEVSRSALRLRSASNHNALRYRAAQALPNETLVGVDRGIRALTAALAADADLLTQLDRSDEALADFAVFEIPQGVVARANLFAQHNVFGDSSLAIELYEVLSGDDDALLIEGVGYTTGAPAALGHVPDADTPRTRIECSEIIDARTAARKITFIASGFQVPGALDGNWFYEFEVFHHA